MSDHQAFDSSDTPTIEVRVYRHDELIQRELCESEEQAAAVLEGWSELDDVRCEVDDLSFHHRPGDVLEPAPPEPVDEDYPHEPTTESESESEARA
jgi:hypothetical protein